MRTNRTKSDRDFNSIKVRLERSSEDTEVAKTEFQFHKGTIRTVHQKIQKLQKLNFNSIKVRLEHVIVTETTIYTEFQFHKGTIRTGV